MALRTCLHISRRVNQLRPCATLHHDLDGLRSIALHRRSHISHTMRLCHHLNLLVISALMALSVVSLNRPFEHELTIRRMRNSRRKTIRSLASNRKRTSNRRRLHMTRLRRVGMAACRLHSAHNHITIGTRRRCSHLRYRRCRNRRTQHTTHQLLHYNNRRTATATDTATAHRIVGQAISTSGNRLVSSLASRQTPTALKSPRDHLSHPPCR